MAEVLGFAVNTREVYPYIMISQYWYVLVKQVDVARL